MKLISTLAPAKINLYLHILGKTENGYHLIDSLAVFANIGDVVEVAQSDKITVTTTGDYAGFIADNDNIVTKAALSLHKHFNVKSGAAITLHKNLPVGSGMGGGSADAAAAISLLVRLWKINAPQKDLHEIALSLGSDVPACMQSGPLYMSGSGEIIEPAPKLPGLCALLVGTGKQLLTKDVYNKYSGSFSTPANRMKKISQDDFIKFLKTTRNDLQNPAIELMPEISEIIKTLEDEKDCLIARMSGSGSTCFGLFAKRKYADDIAIKLGRKHPSWWIRVAGLI